MAEDQIKSIIDIDAIKEEFKIAESEIDKLVKHIQSVKQTNIGVSGAQNLSEYQALKKELDDLIKKTNVSAKAALDEAKARNENSKAALNEAKARDTDSKAADRQAKATKTASDRATEAQRPYKQLALAFAAAAKEAQDLAAKYGVHNKQAQEAAKVALGLNDRLKQIDASIGNHQREVGNYGKAVEGLGEKLKHLGLEFLSLIGIVSVGSFLKDSIDEFLELDKAMRLLQNTLKNIGAPELFGRLEEKTKDLTKQFKYLKDEDIQSSFNKLIIYGKLTENQINELIPVIIDFAASTGRDLPEATALIIKAMEGNGKALKEFGINIKDAKSPAEGFSLIMKELAPRVKGVADAFGESAAGKIAATREEFTKMKEEVGRGLIPVFTALLTGLDKVLTGLGYLGKKTKEVFDDILSFGVSAGERAVATQLRIEKEVADDFIKTFDDKPIIEVSDAINDLNIRLEKRQKTLAAAKRNYSGIFSKQDVADEEQAIRIIRKELEGLYKLQDTNKNKVLGPGDPNKPFAEGKDKKGKDLVEAEARARLEIFKIETEQQAAHQKEIADNEKLHLAERLAALDKYIKLKNDILEADAEFEFRTADLTNSEKLLIEKKRIDESLKLAKTGADDLLKILKSTDPGASFTGTVEGMTKSIAKAFDDINKKGLEAKKNLEDNIKAIKDAAKQLISEVQGLIFDLFTADIDRQKNAIQDRIDLLDKQKEKEIEVAQAAVGTAEQRAASIAIIEARAAAQKEQLQARQRQLDQQKAKFDRAEQVVNIIGNTAVAVAKALGSGPPPGNIILAAIVGAIGAVQLARVLSQPIPKYAKGTGPGGHSGGPMVVGDGGKSEGIVLPDGTVLKTPNKSTIVDAPAGTKVFPDYEKMMLTATMTGVPEFKVRTVGDGTKDAINRIGNDIVRAIKNQPVVILRPEPAYKKFMRQGNTDKKYIN